MTQFVDESIQFDVIPAERIEDVLQFIAENFLPDEPVMRSLGIERNKLFDGWIGEAIKMGSSVMATDSTGKIIGVRLTEIVDKSNWVKKIMDRALMNLTPKIAWVFRDKKMRKWSKGLLHLSREIKFDVWDLFDELGCRKILNDVCVCTSKESRVKGLGTELVKQGEARGKEKGCEYSVNMVTGLYSGKIFREKLSYTVMNEIIYSEFLDKNGNLYLNNTREHLSCFTCYKKLIDPNSVSHQAVRERPVSVHS